MTIPKISLPPWSLALRLTVWYAATAFLLVAGAAWVQYRTLSDDLAGEDDQLLLETLAITRTNVASVPVAVPASGLVGPIVRVLDRSCRLVGGAPLPEGPPPVCPAAAGPATTSTPTLRTWMSPRGRTWRIVSQRVPEASSAPPSDATAAWKEVLLDRWTDTEVLRGYRHELALVLPTALVLSAVLGFWLARRGLAPIQALAGAVSRVDARSLDRRLDVPEAPTEVRALVASFEGMRERLNHAFAALTQFSCELAHEFRTPLHVLRQQSEVALGRARTPEEYREIVSSNLEEVERLRRMVDDILFLARAEDPRSRIERAPLALAAELADVADYLEPLASEQQVHLATDVTHDLHLRADRMLLRRALVNLVTNAIRHTPPGGRVTLAAERRDDVATIAVHDTGAGIPGSALPHVFDRYFRVPGTSGGSTEGTGLGLAIVRGIMSLHGGTAAVTSTPGRGTCVTLVFPSEDREHGAPAKLTKL